MNVFARSLPAALLLLFNPSQLAMALPDEELEQIRDGFDARRDAYLAEYLEEPFYEIDKAAEVCGRELKHGQWIWYPQEDAAKSAPIGARYFRREIALPADRTLRTAFCAFAADNYGDIYVNGAKTVRAGGFQRATFIDISRLLEPGVNVLAVEAHNAGDEANPAGLLGVICLEFEQGEPTLILTDGGWRVSDSAPADWNSTDFDDSRWKYAEVIGAAGCPPWGVVSESMEVETTLYAFSRLTFALAALHLETDLDRANAAILESIARIRKQQQTGGEFGLHWMGGAFFRIYGLFGPGGPMEGRLSNEASEAIWQLYAEWARTACTMAEADPEHTWYIRGSENHSGQHDASAWAAARMIAADPRGADFRYDDGSTPADQLSAWGAFLKRYFRERVKRGMLIEISPSGYGSRTLQGWHNIYDFTEDPELRDLAKSALDVWWAEWAQEQLGGMRGGGKTRLYPGVWALSRSDRNRAMSWFYLGQGRRAHHHETLPVIATTSYRLPLVIMDIALDPAGRGVYECRSRRLGRNLDAEATQMRSQSNEKIDLIDPEYGGIIKYSYCTPDFIIGSLMLESQPTNYWTGISQQNRWHGIIFAGPEDSTLYPRCETARSTYNEQWAVQNRGTLITQKLRHAVEAKAMRVCFSTDLERHEEGGWIFARATRAFAAVKIVQGGWSWDDERWLRCDEEYTPLIFEVARSQDYNDDFPAFKTAVLEQTIALNEGVLHYTGMNGSGDFTFYAESDRLPELNGQPMDLKPNYAFKSPFLNEDWASGVVHIAKDDREFVIDVRENNGD